jgi:hypothetical protein
MYPQIETWLTLGLLALSGAAFIYMLYRSWVNLITSKLEPNDVLHFLYPVDRSLLESLLDPAADLNLRWNLDAHALRAEQRRRIYILRGLVKRMIHNSVVLSDFDVSILGDCKYHDERDSKLRRAIIKVHIYCQATRVRLGVRLLLPYAFGLIATRGLSRLRKVASVDGPRAYEELRAAALEAFAQLRPDELEALNRGL